ncbi:hypothetical protein BS329_21085 [Amycolatopsis coloradensis]|uniref:Carrier domain-containing protein n=1 Tax=Amycolatopsis coloradensis TaxID=76021 RepID=A0A1R0KR57_9PSEU|nr:acyl carrier protein [Amycolatopsis coloradensis]OLZ50113.1 hypothetical protein BS329_21085 [Amycolatopsis coloradensis]
MRDSEIHALIKRLLLADNAAVAEMKVDGGTSLATGGLELTSLELIRLLVGLEESLDIELDDEMIMNSHFGTVDDVVELVGRGLTNSGRELSTTSSS